MADYCTRDLVARRVRGYQLERTLTNKRDASSPSSGVCIYPGLGTLDALFPCRLHGRCIFVLLFFATFDLGTCEPLGKYADFFSPMKSTFWRDVRTVTVKWITESLEVVTRAHTGEDGRPGKRLSSDYIVDTIMVQLDSAVRVFAMYSLRERRLWILRRGSYQQPFRFALALVKPSQHDGALMALLSGAIVGRILCACHVSFQHQFGTGHFLIAMRDLRVSRVEFMLPTPILTG